MVSEYQLCARHPAGPGKTENEVRDILALVAGNPK